MKIHEFTATKAEETFRVSKSAQELIITRTSRLAIFAAGLLSGLPERISAEITNAHRNREEQGDRIPLSEIAFWGQFGRGPITETVPTNWINDANFGLGDEDGGAGALTTVTTKVHYYLSQSGPIELVAEDQFNVTMTNLVIGATYSIESPEMPVVATYANELYRYERSTILGSDTSKEIFTAGAAGIIIPNDPSAIQRIVATIQIDENTTKQVNWSLPELLATQSQANPHVSQLQVTSVHPREREVRLVASGTAELLQVSLNHMPKIEIHTTLGREVKYTVVRSVTRG